MKKTLIYIVCIVLCSACDKQRDLYDMASPLLSVEGDWVPSLDKPDMSQNATAMVYNTTTIAKEYFLNPRTVTTRVTKGKYYILLFNGMMFSEDNTNLDDIYFRETNDIQQFEAFAAEGEVSKRLLRSEGEIIASNDMEILTSRQATTEIKGESAYYKRYENGERTDQDVSDYVEDQIKLTPKPVSYPCQVVIELINPSSAFSATGALRGFVGSVKMASRMPSHRAVTHHLKLNNLRITQPGTPGDPANPERGTIQSPVFVTFGPPIDLPDQKYEFELVIVLKNGQVLNWVFDITEQVQPMIEAIRYNLDETVEIPVKVALEIDVPAELPEIDPDSDSEINVGEWGDDEIIKIPIIV